MERELRRREQGDGAGGRCGVEPGSKMEELELDRVHGAWKRELVKWPPSSWGADGEQRAQKWEDPPLPASNQPSFPSPSNSSLVISASSSQERFCLETILSIALYLTDENIPAFLITVDICSSGLFITRSFCNLCSFAVQYHTRDISNKDLIFMQIWPARRTARKREGIGEYLSVQYYPKLPAGSWLVFSVRESKKWKTESGCGCRFIPSYTNVKMLCPERLLYRFRSGLLIEQNSRREAACGMRAAAFSGDCFSMWLLVLRKIVWGSLPRDHCLMCFQIPEMLLWKYYTWNQHYTEVQKGWQAVEMGIYNRTATLNGTRQGKWVYMDIGGAEPPLSLPTNSTCSPHLRKDSCPLWNLFSVLEIAVENNSYSEQFGWCR